MEFYIEKVYCKHEKVVFYKNMFKRPKRLKMDTLFSFREGKCIQCLFSFFNQSIQINRKLLKNEFWFKIIFFFVKEMVFL